MMVVYAGTSCGCARYGCTERGCCGPLLRCDRFLVVLEIVVIVGALAALGLMVGWCRAGRPTLISLVVGFVWSG